MRKILARLISNVLNPFLVSFAVIVVLAFESTNDVAEAVKWLLVSIVLSIIPVFAFIIYMIRKKKLDGIFVNTRQQRNKVYLLATVLAVIGWLILKYALAPKLLFVTFAAGLAAIVVFMLINLCWKISLHTGFITAAATMMIIVYGTIVLWSLLLVPLVAWGRVELKLHTPAQVTGGAVLAAGVVLIIFQLYGMIGNSSVMSMIAP